MISKIQFCMKPDTIWNWTTFDSSEPTDTTAHGLDQQSEHTGKRIARHANPLYFSRRWCATTRFGQSSKLDSWLFVLLVVCSECGWAWGLPSLLADWRMAPLNGDVHPGREFLVMTSEGFKGDKHTNHFARRVWFMSVVVWWRNMAVLLRALSRTRLILMRFGNINQILSRPKMAASSTAEIRRDVK